MRKTVFVTGVNGQLGHDVINELHRRGYTAIGSDRTASYDGIADGSAVADMPYMQMDITNENSVEDIFTDIHPDVAIHCAAWTDVDRAEEEAELAHAVNVAGTQNLANECKKSDCKMVYLSTDYVFDGQGIKPWKPDSKTHPLNVYGRTKLEGEQAVAGMLDQYFIVRASWLFGVNGRNFVKTMLRLGKTHDTLRVVNDQIGTPTYAYDLARLLVDMIETDQYGYYHVTNEGGYISWYDFACEIFRQAGYEINVVPVTTAEYGLNKAARPLNGRLDKSKLVGNGFRPLPGWQDALSRYLMEIQK